MRGRHAFLGVLTLVILLALPALAPARGIAWLKNEVGARTGDGRSSVRLPRLLTEDFSSSFAVRPAKITPTGDASGVISGKHLKSGRIHWKKWNARKAAGVGKMWINDGIPSMAEGTFHGHRATISSFRVRHGRFTRMTVRYRENGKIQTIRYRLVKTGLGYCW